MGVFGKLKRFFTRNAPTLLTGAAVVGVGVTAKLASDASPKARDKIEAMEYDRMRNNEDRMTKWEKFKARLPFYVPTIISGGLTVGSIVGAQAINSERIATLSGALMSAELALNKNQEKIQEFFGEKGVKQIKDAIVKEEVEKNPPPPKEMIKVTDPHANILCQDGWSKQYFRSNQNAIELALLRYLQKLNSYEELSFNEWMDELGLEHIGDGNELHYTIRHPLDIGYSTTLVDGEPVLVIVYNNKPKPYYMNDYS